MGVVGRWHDAGASGAEQATEAEERGKVVEGV